MAWNEQEPQAQSRNPIEGSLGKFIAIIISVVALVLSQAHPPMWVILVLGAVVVVSAVMMMRSPFTVCIRWIRNTLLRRHVKAVHMKRLNRLSTMIERLLNPSYVTSFYNMLIHVSTTGKPSLHASMTERQELQALSSWNNSLQASIRYSTAQSFEAVIHCHDVLIHHYISFARNAGMRLQQVLADPEVPPQNKESIRRTWDECRSHANELITSWRVFRMDYEASLGKNVFIDFEEVASL